MMTRRDSTSSDADIGRNESGNFSFKLFQYSGPSYLNLPREILENILLRLTVRRILICKCVCKTWYGLISEPKFAMLHFKQAQVCPLIRTSSNGFESIDLYLLEADKEDFELKLDMCDHRESCYNSECSCRVNVKLDARFELLSHNLEEMIHDDYLINPDWEAEKNKHDGIELHRHNNRRYHTVNPCNGFLCFAVESDNEPVIIYNPITGEFISLPKPMNNAEYPQLPYCISYGFGFSSVTDQYKVIRMFKGADKDVITGQACNIRIVVEVYVLGTESWRKVCNITEQRYFNLYFPTYLNGCVYWYCPLEYSIVYFDIEKESFSLFSAPIMESRAATIGVLGGELCICVTHCRATHVWVMREDGFEKAWTKVFSGDLSIYNCMYEHGPYKPIKYMNDGALLMLHIFTEDLVYKDPRKHRFRFLDFHGSARIMAVHAHIPSFLSFKDVVHGLRVKVHNVNSSLPELKLQENSKQRLPSSISLNDNRCLSLVEYGGMVEEEGSGNGEMYLEEYSGSFSCR